MHPCVALYRDTRVIGFTACPRTAARYLREVCVPGFPTPGFPTIIFPARNDDFAVGAVCKSYYSDLLAAGVKIYEYQAGLLHAKTMTVDDEITLIGSANMDRRSFDLNYENNILLNDKALTGQMLQRQQEFLADCRQITVQEVAGWSWRQRLRNNSLAIVGPVL